MNTSYLNPKKEIVLAPLILATEDAVVATSSNQIKTDPREVVIPVLTYHYIQEFQGNSKLTQSLSVSPPELEKQFQYLAANGFTTIDPSELYEAVLRGQELPAKSVLLTFDDGYKDFFINAYPLLKKYQLKATNFVSVGLLGSFQYMSKEEVRQLAQDPLITLGSHTIHHPDLTSSTKESAWDEIDNGKKLLEDLIGKEVTIFAYPFGLFNSQVVSQVSESGFKLAFTTQRGIVHQPDQLLTLPRLTVQGKETLEEFKVKFSGFRD